jgi:hypothetical protein
MYRRNAGNIDNHIDKNIRELANHRNDIRIKITEGTITLLKQATIHQETLPAK